VRCKLVEICVNYYIVLRKEDEDKLKYFCQMFVNWRDWGITPKPSLWVSRWSLASGRITGFLECKGERILRREIGLILCGGGGGLFGLVLIDCDLHIPDCHRNSCNAGRRATVSGLLSLAGSLLSIKRNVCHHANIPSNLLIWNLLVLFCNDDLEIINF
jgi:hypothetical protein